MPQNDAPDFSRYCEFNGTLQLLVESDRLDDSWKSSVDASLDGVAGSELRRLVDLPSRRAYGAFFTGSSLAERLIRSVDIPVEGTFLFDPTVGAGDLLLAAAKRLPCEATLLTTLVAWGKMLAGTDIQPEFIEATKLRIALLAKLRTGGKEPLPTSWRQLLPNICVGDGQEQQTFYQKATHLLMNPPFSLRQAPNDCCWASGRVSEAAILVVKALEQVAPGTELFAILPDVLRSGSFQRRWRERLAELAMIQAVERYGTFDEAADVDVFVLEARRRSAASKKQSKRWPEKRRVGTTIKHYFDVHVGRVVPHRDKEVGTNYPYIHPRCTPTWTTLRAFTESRRFDGKVYSAPFVAIRRTSRKGHPFRATATVVAGRQQIAVENHLIVCKPKDDTLRACQRLMRQLKTQAVNDFLNDEICCRHLTVGAVMNIPVEF